jgi:hypothetical protein
LLAPQILVNKNGVLDAVFIYQNLVSRRSPANSRIILNIAKTAKADNTNNNNRPKGWFLVLFCKSAKEKP